MKLDEQEEKSLNRIRKAVESGQSLADCLDLARQLKNLTDTRHFSFFYMGLLLARHGRIADALQSLSFLKENCLAGLLADFLKEHGSLMPKGTLFQDPRIYDIHNQTRLYKEFMPNTVEAILSFARKSPPLGGKNAVIMDVGPGNGYLLEGILKNLLKIYPLERIRLFLIESSLPMLDRCVAYCREKIPVPIDFVPIHSTIEAITEEVENQIRKSTPIWFINASASLHHMPAHVKEEILKKLKTFSSRLLLSEFNACLDIPERDSPQLAYSAMSYFNPPFESVINDRDIAAEKGRALLRQYYMVETINILAKSRLARGDYQATAGEWEALLEKAGGRILCKTNTSNIGYEGYTFTMEVSF